VNKGAWEYLAYRLAVDVGIDMDNNALDIDLAKSVGASFRLREKEMDKVIDEVKSVVSRWQKLAVEIGIPRSEQTLMTAAFKV
jgi:serine/threonine-protein kinase HipA